MSEISREKSEPNSSIQSWHAHIFDLPASQAIEPPPPISKSIKEAADASAVVLNVQITNVPEVSQSVGAEQWLQHLDVAFAAGAQAVRPVEKWMMAPNSVSDTLVQIGPTLDNAINYYANTTPDHIGSDVTAVVGQIGEGLDTALSFPRAPNARAKAAGEIMPLVFTDGLGTSAESAALKTADAIATHVDRAVLQTIEQSLEAIKKAPDLAAEIKQGLYEFLKSKGLSAKEAEYAGIPRGFFDDIQRSTPKDDGFFAMSKAEEGERLPKPSGKREVEIKFQIDKETGRLQRTDMGKIRQPYAWPVLNEKFDPSMIRQSREHSCVSAVGAVLSRGKLTEAELIGALGTPASMDALAQKLGQGWTSSAIDASVRKISENGAWAVMLSERKFVPINAVKPPHAVIVDGLNSSGNVMIRDPLEGTICEMTLADFREAFTGYAVYRIK